VKLQLDQLTTLKLTGMHKALCEQLNMPDMEAMDFMTRLGLMADRETTERANRRLTTRLKKAKLRQQACFEDIDFRTHTARAGQEADACTRIL